METIKKAIECHKKGDFANAEIFYLQYLEKNPDSARAYHLLGALYKAKKEYNKAQNALNTALRLENIPEIELELAFCYFENNDFSNALPHFQNILKTTNDNDLEKILYDKIIECAKKLDLADIFLEYSIKSLKFDPENIHKLREIAALAQDMEKFDTAKKYLEKLIEITPNDYVSYNNLGLVYEFTSDFKNAENCYRKAIAIKPNPEALYNLSVILRCQRKYEDALKTLELTKQFDTNIEKFNHTFGVLHLVQKDFKTGYKPYLDFFKKKQLPDIKDEFWWDGTKNKNATLAICATGGFGDVIMYSRYLDFINPDDFKEIILIVPKNLKSLYTYNFPQFKIIEMGINTKYNFATTLMDLPYIFNLDFAHIPSGEKYLLTPPKYVEKWQKYFAQNKTDKKIKIGIFFAGNASNKRTLRNRNINLKALKTIFSIEDIKFYSMQPEGVYKEQLKTNNIMDLSGEIENFSDTAAIIDNMDLIISIDSSVAHLSGALGKETFLLLPYSADWRWFEDDSKTPWYNNTKIYRQTIEGDWMPVVKNLENALKSKL